MSLYLLLLDNLNARRSVPVSSVSGTTVIQQYQLCACHTYSWLDVRSGREWSQAPGDNGDHRGPRRTSIQVLLMVLLCPNVYREGSLCQCFSQMVSLQWRNQIEHSHRSMRENLRSLFQWAVEGASCIVGLSCKHPNPEWWQSITLLLQWEKDDMCYWNKFSSRKEVTSIVSPGFTLSYFSPFTDTFQIRTNSLSLRYFKSVLREWRSFGSGLRKNYHGIHF